LGIAPTSPAQTAAARANRLTVTGEAIIARNMFTGKDWRV
jgi:hypothetical protein